MQTIENQLRIQRRFATSASTMKATSYFQREKLLSTKKYVKQTLRVLVYVKERYLAQDDSDEIT